jgi:5-methylcytosine-specific restriction endonuclease McrA
VSPVRLHNAAGYSHGCRCSTCTTARREYARGWRERKRKRARTYSRAYHLRVKELVAELKGTTCLDCGNDFPPRQLHFHHLDPATRSFTLAHAPWHSYDAVRKEAAKCVVLCQSCHATRHKEV